MIVPTSIAPASTRGSQYPSSSSIRSSGRQSMSNHFGVISLESWTWPLHRWPNKHRNDRGQLRSGRENEGKCRSPRHAVRDDSDPGLFLSLSNRTCGRFTRINVAAQAHNLAGAKVLHLASQQDLLLTMDATPEDIAERLTADDMRRSSHPGSVRGAGQARARCVPDRTDIHGLRGSLTSTPPSGVICEAQVRDGGETAF